MNTLHIGGMRCLSFVKVPFLNLLKINDCFFIPTLVYVPTSVCEEIFWHASSISISSSLLTSTWVYMSTNLFCLHFYKMDGFRLIRIDSKLCVMRMIIYLMRILAFIIYPKCVTQLCYLINILYNLHRLFKTIFFLMHIS